MNDECPSPIHKRESCIMNLFEARKSSYSIQLLKMSMKYSDFHFNLKIGPFIWFSFKISMCNATH